MEDKFIITDDDKTAERLEKEVGLVRVGFNGVTYTFLNPGEMKFSERIKDHIAYTSKITF